MGEINWRSIYTHKALVPAVDPLDKNGLSATKSIPYQAFQATKNQKRKFDSLLHPIPWYSDVIMNLTYTLEWLLRDSRKDKIRFNERNLIKHIKDNWFISEIQEGQIVHVCYPKELINYRMKYESVYGEYVNLDSKEMSIKPLYLINHAKNLLWAQWKCIGFDGSQDVDGIFTGLPHYNYNCNRCQTKMLKNVKAYVILTKSRLAALNAENDDARSEAPF